MFRYVRFLILSCVLAWLTLSCAGTKVNLVKAYSGIETALATVDDTERQLCWGTTKISGFTKAQLATCTVKTPGLTDAVHQQIQAKLIDALNRQQALGPAIKAWTVNTPPPDLTAALTDAQAVLDLIQPLTGQPKWLGQAQSWLNSLTALLTQIKGLK